VGPTLLYLDTARLGRMTPGARQAHLDFTRLAGEEGGSALFDHFLRLGVDAWPGALRDRYPGLSSWQGLGPLKESLRTLAGSDPGLPVLVANRSTQLMKLAARLLFHPCCNILVTDVGWPAYHELLCAEACRASRSVTTVSVRECLLSGQAGEGDLIDLIRSRFLRERCDGLFLPAVSHLGVRLPVERLVRTLEEAGEVRFVVIDGAQDFCHTSADLRNEYCDLYLTGSHKWLGAYDPMGLGFYGRRKSLGVIETVLGHLAATGNLDDPLLRFSKHLETGATDGWSETVNLASLFSCQGAVTDALEASRQPTGCLSLRLANASAVAAVASSAGWRPLVPTEGFRTGILLLQAERDRTRKMSAGALREAFCEQGVALTAYDDGIVRLSIPGGSWQPSEINHLQAALLSLA